MVKRCVVQGCKSESHGGCGISFFKYPKDVALRQKWIDYTGRHNWYPTKYSRVCSKHFHTNCIRKAKNNRGNFLLPGSVPYISAHMAPLTGAERQRKYREKLKENIEKYQERLKERRIKYMKRKRKAIAEMSENEKQHRCRQWRTADEARNLRQQSSCKIKETENIVMSKANYLELLRKIKDLQENSEVLIKINKDLRRQCYRQEKSATLKLNNFKLAEFVPSSSKSTVFGTLITNVEVERKIPVLSTDMKEKMNEVPSEVPVIKSEEIPELKCRTCLNVFNEFTMQCDIFQPWNPPWEGMEDTIAEDLMKSTNICIDINDEHSKVICGHCLHSLKEVCIFIKFVKNNDEMLRLRTDIKNDSSVSTLSWPRPIQVEKTLGNPNDSYLESILGVKVKEEVLSEDEVETQWPDSYKNLDIKVEPEELLTPTIEETCNGTYDNSQYLEKNENNQYFANGSHSTEEDLLTRIKEEPPERSANEEDDSFGDLPLECLLCLRHFNSLTGLKAHVIAHHSYKSVKRKTDNSTSPERSYRHICKTCRRRFTTSTDLMVHETCHNKSICYSCNQHFDTFSELSSHRIRCKATPGNNGSIRNHLKLDDVQRF